MDGNKCFDRLGVMVDCSRNSVMTVAAFKRLIAMLSAMGYNTLQLYTEDTFEVNNEPYFGYLRGRYSKTEIKEIDACAAEAGIELIPCVQTLAHLQQIFRWRPYSGINDCGDILLAGEERTYELLENIFSTLAECFISRRVNIGMDEAHMLGLGKYLDKHGYKDRAVIMLEHLERVTAIATKYGFRCAMWSDMFFRLAYGGDYYVDGGDSIPESVLNRIPKNLDLIYWDYYSLEQSRYEAMLKKHANFDNNVIFAGGAWTWCGLAPVNRYGIAAVKAAFAACHSQGVRETFLTLWGDNGGSCSPFAALPVLFTAAELAKGNDNESDIKKKFEAFTGVPFDVFMNADLPNVMRADQPADTRNPSKYLFYNDCLLGIFDSTVREGDGEIYRGHAAKLKIAERYKDWTFLFRPLRLLCEALSLKAELGIRTRTAYKAGDRRAVALLVNTTYKPLIRKIKEFYKAFTAYWDSLYKPHGFDVMDLRLGGVLQRLKHVVDKLSAYADGKCEAVEELEEQLLDFWGSGDVFEKDRALSYNGFATNVTVNNL